MLRLIPLAIAFALTAAALLAQGKLEITSPAAGTVVNPGQTIVVTVSAAGGAFTSVSAGAPGSPEGPTFRKSPPYQFSFTIPKEIALGPAEIDALGATASGDVFADPVFIDLERAESPTSIALSHSSVELQARDILPISVYGTYTDGSTINLTRSTQTKYEPKDGSVVSVRADGIVTALATGSTTVTVRHKDREAAFKIFVSARPR
jgi:hypothetical protein